MEISAENISVCYDRTSAPVIRDVSVRLTAGKLTAVIGANGAGKTTLLKTLNGALPVTNGNVALNGRPLNEFGRREIARLITVIAQETETRFPVSVLEFVLAGRFVQGSAFGWETADDQRIADECLAMCDLAGFQSRLMNHLSGGERQRVVLARALATGARILLLDEPTANLDLAHQIQMFQLVRERVQGCRSTALVITHDLNLAAEFADEILMMKDGEVVASGPPPEVLTEENLLTVFGLKVLLDRNPASGNVRVSLQIGR